MLLSRIRAVFDIALSFFKPLEQYCYLMHRDWKTLLQELTFMIPIPFKTSKHKNQKYGIPIRMDDSGFCEYFHEPTKNLQKMVLCDII